MEYVASNKFRFCRDFIGVDSVTIEQGQVDVVGLKLNEKHIKFMLKENLIDEIGCEQTEVLPVESVVEFEIKSDPMKIINMIDDKKKLDEYAETQGIKLDRRKGLKAMRKQFEDAYENKMINDLENK